MTNIELEQRIKKILENKNYFDLVLEALAFEPEYKKTDFFKKTRKPLGEVIKETKMFYTLNFDSIREKIQELINKLDLEHLMGLINEIGDVFAAENEEIKGIIEELDLKKN